MSATETNTPSVNWKEVIVYYIIAVAVSAPFRLGWVDLSESVPLPMGFTLLYRVLGALGPAVGYFVLIYVMKTDIPRNVSLFGTSRVYSVIGLAIIPLVLAVVGRDDVSGLNTHWNGFLIGITFAIYAVGEELGWRGYLQQALAPIPLPLRVLIIAVLWYLWHLNFLNPMSTIQSQLIHFASLFVGSGALLTITGRTHSILIAAAVHLSFNIIGELGGEMNERLIVLAVAISVWAFVIRRMANLPFVPKSASAG
ncbi:MAG: CPBP family intramembrane glutamic endopeptidase [Chryseolinea sp.]